MIKFEGWLEGSLGNYTEDKVQFPCGFFFCMMVPLNLEHSNGFSSSASRFSV
jgi:hypothetical protein